MPEVRSEAKTLGLMALGMLVVWGCRRRDELPAPRGADDEGAFTPAQPRAPRRSYLPDGGPPDSGTHWDRGLGPIPLQQTALIAKDASPPASVDKDAGPGNSGIPGVTARACQADSVCGSHRCNLEHGRCMFPCSKDADCQSLSRCAEGVCSPLP